MTATVESDYMVAFGKMTQSGPFTLTAEQKDKNLQVRGAVKDIFPIDDTNKMNDCDLVYRFLIGRHWNVAQAEQYIRRYVELRKEEKLNTIMGEHVEPIILPIVSTVYGVDREGLPVLWMTPDPAVVMATLKQFDKDLLLRGQMRVMETARYVAKQLGVDRCTYMIDLRKITMSSINSSILGFVREFSKVLQEYYPEIMRRMLIFNTGWAVSGAWKVMKPFIDARVQDKVRFYNFPPSVKTLDEFIDSKNVLPEYGGTGTNDWPSKLAEAETKRLADLLKAQGRTPTPPATATKTAAAGNELAAQASGAGSLTPHDDYGDLAMMRLYSINVSFSTSRVESAEVPYSQLVRERMVIGDPSVLRSLNGSPLRREPMKNDLVSESSATEDYNCESGDSANATPPNQSLETPKRPLCISLVQCVNGNVSGYRGSRHIADLRSNVVYAVPASGDNDDNEDARGRKASVSATLSPSAPHVGEWEVGYLMKESGHPIHNFIIVCDKKRLARFVIRKSRLRSRLTVFQIIGDATVMTDAKGRHFIAGERVKMGVVVPHKSATEDDGAWMLYGEDVTKRSKKTSLLSSIKRSWPLDEIRDETKDSSALLVECKGLVMLFHGFLRVSRPTELFALSVAIMRMWSEGRGLYDEAKKGLNERIFNKLSSSQKLGKVNE